MAALREKYDSALKGISAADSAFSDYLREEVSVEFSKVSFKFVPDVLTSDEFNTLRQFIKETDDVILSMGA
jgi:hypothetical protein